MNNTIIESERINFINVSTDLANDYLDMLNDRETSRYLSLKERKYSYDGEIKWIKEKLDNKDIIFSMIEKETGEFIGNIELKKNLMKMK